MNINELSKEYSFLENMLPPNKYELLEIKNNHFLFLRNDGDYCIFNFSLGINKHPTIGFYNSNKEISYSMFDLLSNSNPNKLFLTRDSINSCYIAISLNEKPINKNSFVYYQYNNELNIIERKESLKKDLQIRPFRFTNETLQLRNALLVTLGVISDQYININFNDFPIIDPKPLASKGDIISFSNNYNNEFYFGKVVSCRFDIYKEDYMYTIVVNENHIHCHEKDITHVHSKDNILLEEIKEYYSFIKKNKDTIILNYFNFENTLEFDR